MRSLTGEWEWAAMARSPGWLTPGGLRRSVTGVHLAEARWPVIAATTSTAGDMPPPEMETVHHDQVRSSSPLSPTPMSLRKCRCRSNGYWRNRE